jgi:ribosome-binding protein aMBF1 (putative translation factor)
MTRRRKRPIQLERKSSTRKSPRGAKKPKNSGRKRRARLAAKPALRTAKVRRLGRSRRSKRLTAQTAAQLAAAIAGARANAGLSQVRLAGAFKSDQANIVRLEKGRSVPSVRTLFRIAKATGHKLTITFNPLRA